MVKSKKAFLRISIWFYLFGKGVGGDFFTPCWFKIGEGWVMDELGGLTIRTKPILRLDAGIDVEMWQKSYGLKR